MNISPMDVSDETGFDRRLRDLAIVILDEEAPSLDGVFGRDGHVFSIFIAMQGFAAVKGLSGTPNDIAACETVGRALARMKASGERA